MTVFDWKEMTEAFAREMILWKYPEPYAVYNMRTDEAEVEQLMNGLHMAVVDETGALSGFLAFGWSAQVVCGETESIYADESFSDLGLGLRPDLCGRGKGRDLVKCGIAFLKELFPEDGVRLTVRGDNQRAITLYEKMNFKKSFHFTCENIDYWIMTLSE